MIRIHGFFGVVLGIAVTCWSAAAPAVEGLRFSGFGTVGHVSDDHDDLAPMRDISQLVDYSVNQSWVMDSRLGVQLEYGLPDATLIAQVVGREQFRGSMDSAVEMAYLAFSPLASLDVRLGRVNYDTFMMADIRNVGYAYTWVRPPIEFYGWIPIFSVNGADVAYNIRNEDALWRAKLQKGSGRFWIPVANGANGGYDFHAEKLTGVSLSRQTATWQLKTAYSQFICGNEVATLAPLHQGLAQVAAMGGDIGAEAADLLRNDSFKGAKVTYRTIGAAYDDGVWNVHSEFGHATTTAAVVPHGKMAYLSVARRVEDWTPFAAYSVYRPDNALRTPQNDWGAGLNSALRDPAAGLADTTRISQRTTSLGARWDFRLNAAVKLQWDHTEIDRYGYGLWYGRSGTYPAANRVNVLSATVDFVF